MSDEFMLLYTSFFTGMVQGYPAPVPIGDRIFFEMKKEVGVDPKTREFFHAALDEWLNCITNDPEQSGNRMECAFKIEYRGDTDDWMTTEEQAALTAKETISVRLAEILKLAQTK
jgi:hypothetical protein